MKYCNRCKQNKPLDQYGKTFDKRSNKYFPRHQCKECLNEYAKTYKQKHGNTVLIQRRKNRLARRIKDPVLYHIKERISSWRSKDLQSDLTTEYLLKLWNKQCGLCYYTGVKMTPGNKRMSLSDSASLDKLDPNKGYRQGNVVWASHLANSSKGGHTEPEFYNFCKLVIEINDKRIMDYKDRNHKQTLGYPHLLASQ